MKLFDSPDQQDPTGSDPGQVLTGPPRSVGGGPSYPSTGTPTTGGTPSGSTVPAFGYTTPAYGGPMSPQYGAVPQFNAPRFEMPDFSKMTADPSYQFRLNQGNEALNASAAAQGILRTGGTLKAIEDYGQNAASQEASNIFDRAIKAYTANYQAAKDAYAPKLAAYQNSVGGANLGFQRALDLWEFPITDERQREQMLTDAFLRTLPAQQQQGGGG